MISRALLVALCIVYATSLSPLSVSADDDCALYLTGPGRSSAYDYSLNLLKGNFAYDGQHTCITYEAINQAYLDARSRILVSQPKGDWKGEDFASVGELILDISISLARTYGLTYEEIEKGLPLIDTSRTLIREVCPPVFSHVECRAGKYRRLDGLCNNLRHPTWGATMAPFQRLIGPLFADGINAPRISHTGRDLPLSRVVSRTMHPDDGFHDHAGTVMVIAWGQFMDHDYTLTGTPLDPIHRNDPEECCKRPPHLKHPYCNEIRVPDDDYFYRLFGVKCIDFVRGFPSPRPGCRLGSRVPFNTLTGVLDGNTVYGVTEKFARKLRTGYGGLLRMNPVFKEYGLKDLLPLKLDIPDEGCTRPNKNMYCFEAGEIRVNEQLVLTVMHTLMAREHNRVATGLAAVNPHWDDETLYQEARRINIAEIQHITYNEFLPILLGKDVMEKFGLVLEKEGYWDGYDPEVNPDVIASFAAAAYRFGHSLLPTAVERWSKAHKFIASKRLSDLIRRPYDLYRAGVLDEYVMGLMNQVAQAMDDSITQEVTNHLFKKVGARFGMDLVSFNMQRGREFGLPGYMEFRKFCGLSGADSFQDLFGSMANETIQKYESIFEHPIDVDLWSGGVSERPLPGSMLGPTFACVIATQFSYSRRGDRFWFELRNQPSSFTPEQLKEVRKARLARVICDNTDIIDTVQLYPMVLPDHELNPRVPCRSGIIPSMDFSKWAEPTPFVTAKEYMTDAFVCNQTSNSTQNISKIQNPKSDIININITKNDDCNNSASHSPSKHNNTLDLITDIGKHDINRKNNDTVLKYIFKKNTITSHPEKSKGYFKNSIKRKKRSEGTDVENTDEDDINPLTLANFDSKRIVKDREELALPELTPNGIIKSTNLADFNIETLHDNTNPDETNEDDIIEANQEPRNPKQPRRFSVLNKEISKKREDVSKNDEFNRSDQNDQSREYIGDERDLPKYSKYRTKETQNHSESAEDLSNQSKNFSNESFEIEPYSHNDKFKKTFNNERDEYIQNKHPVKVSHSDQTSREIEEEIKHRPTQDTFNNSKVIQDVDKDDFSYEHVPVNSKEKTESTKDSQEKSNNEDDESNVKVPPKQEAKSTISNNNKYLSNEKYDTNNSEENNNPISFNDGEIKPVIELNKEDSSEEKDENNRANLKEGDDSLLETKQRHELRMPKDGKVNLKQQFERIPLDYNHTASKPVPLNTSDSTENNNDDDDSEGTLDALSPVNNKFDENLNTKFTDLTIKLPEIKLPEDILSYAREESPKDTSKEKAHNDYDEKYEFDNNEDDGDDEEEESKEKLEHSKRKNEEKDENDFYSPYFSNNEKLQEPTSSNESDGEDDHEDLYEKFVRERFGKSKSHSQKSDKLQRYESRPVNPKLYKTVQNILKKADKTEKEAIKSGDPEAAYMWTLEYGENL